jgi:hypothetical protein
MGSRALLLIATTLVSGLVMSAPSAAQTASPCASVICGTGNTGTPIGITTGLLGGTVASPPTPAQPTLGVLPQGPAPASLNSGVLNNGSAPGAGYGPGAGSYPAGAAGFGPAINPGAEAGTYAGPNAGSLGFGAGTNPMTGGGLFEVPSSTPARPVPTAPSATEPSIPREELGPGFGGGINPKSGLEPPLTP